MKFEKLNFLIVLFSIIAIGSFSLTISTDEAWSQGNLDRDRDGISDEFDECPYISETYNKFEDTDGCPDSVSEEKIKFEFPDSDGDGIDDRWDSCILLPETFNGYQDGDGCPEIETEKSYGELDSDSDTIPNSIDACPLEKETFNAFKDADGCPDSLEPTVISSSKESLVTENQCTGDKVAVMRVNTNNLVCVTLDTAERWEELGIGEIVGKVVVTPTEEEKPIEKELPLGIETIETRSGTITIDHDYLTPESAKLLSDELFFQRAVQVYHLALPAVGGAGIFYEQDKVGATTGDVLYWSDFMNSDIELLTGNTSVLYFMTLQDLSDGPIVVHVPAGNLQGHVDNIYQQVITDYGIVGPNEGNEALFLILPPNYAGEIPPNFDGETENYFVEQSDTMQFLAMGRAFVNAPDMAAAEELIKKVNVYNLSEIDNSPQVQFFDVSGESLKLSHPQTEGFWEFLHEVYSKETFVRPEDKNLIGLMRTIGIVPGEPFEPDEQSKEILDKAAVVADLMARNIAYDSPVKEPFIYWPDKNWELAFMTKNPRYEDERGATQIEPRLSFMYQAITTADAMVLELVGKGSKYVGTYRDADENFLIGSNTYHLNIPADVPAENFWSIVAYDAETRSMIKNDVQPLPAIRSLDSDKLIQNEDGSYDVYFGPEAPEGYENNWVKTNEGDGFFVFMRFYSPTEAYYDKSWQLPMVELMK